MEPMKGDLTGSLENGQHDAAPELFIWLMGKLKGFIVAFLIHVLLTDLLQLLQQREKLCSSNMLEKK